MFNLVNGSYNHFHYKLATENNTNLREFQVGPSEGYLPQERLGGTANTRNHKPQLW